MTGMTTMGGAAPALFLATMVVLHLVPPAISSAPRLIPADLSKLDGWVTHNIKPYNQRKTGNLKAQSALDPALAAAEDGVRVITVRKDGSGQFKTIADAVKSVPSRNTRRTIIWIGGGQYYEKITIDRSKPFITFYGSPNAMPTITFDGTANKYGTVYSATVAVESNYFMAVNVAFVNSAPKPDGKRPGAQAVAMRISGDKAAFYNCKFIGYQDTLCDDRGRHFFKDCYIQGTVDFIFGDGKSLYLNSEIHSVADQIGVITAQARQNVADDSGFIFVHCKISGTSIGSTFLGRAWMERPRVVFAYTSMGNLVNPQGWSDGLHREREKTVYYGEYKCKGAGASTGGRAKYTKLMTGEEIRPFLSMTYIRGNKWLLPPPKL